MKKRLFALFLVLCMAVALLPVSVLAEDEHEHGDDCCEAVEVVVETVAAQEPVPVAEPAPVVTETVVEPESAPVVETGTESKPAEETPVETEPTEPVEEPAEPVEEPAEPETDEGGEALAQQPMLYAAVPLRAVAATDGTGDGTGDDDAAAGDEECKESTDGYHDWSNKDGVCAKCNAPCSHDWTASGCSICGKTCGHEVDPTTCKCGNCGLYFHNWNADTGVCDTCKTVCVHSNGWGDGYCMTCGYKCPHNSWTDGVCDTCTTVCLHTTWNGDEEKSEWNDGVCNLCGCVCPHKEYNEDGTCAVCGKMKEAEPEPEPPHEHSYSSAVTTAATCVTAGVRTYTCSCGDSYTETISARGHYYYFSARTEPTCGAAGTLTYTCEKCGYSYTMETKPATGEHDYVDYSEAGGILGKRCTVCGKIVSNHELIIKENSIIIDEVKKKKLSQTEVGWADSGENGEIIEIEQSRSDSDITKNITIKSPEDGIDGLLYKITDDQTGEVTETVTVKTGGDDVHELTFGRESGGEGSGASYHVEENGETVVAREVSVSKNAGVITYEFTTDEGTEVTIEKGESEPLTVATDENGLIWLAEESLTVADEGSTVLKGGIVLRVNGDNEVLEYSFGERSERTEGNEGVRLDEYMEQTGATELVIAKSLSDVKFDTGIDGSLVFVGDIVLEDWQPSDNAEEQTEPTPSPTPTPEPENEEETEEEAVTYVEIVFGVKDLTPEEDEEESDESEEEQPTIEERPNNEPDTIEEYQPNDSITYIVPFVQPEEAKEFQRETTEYEREVVDRLPEDNRQSANVKCSKCGADIIEGKEHECKSACVPTGTMITLADGTQKPVESVTESDLLLVYDHEAGAFTTASINFIERNEAAMSTVVTLAFSDGSDTALVYEHGYFDLNEMRYVFLTAENAEDHIGHRFYKAEIVDGVYTPVEATLTAVTVTEEVVASYDFPTKYHLNFFADGFLSMPAETAGLTNFFAYDDDLAYNTESMTAAIEQYGLLEYADLAAWLTEDEFVSYPAQYLSVNYGNGTLTQETLIELIETYVHEYR